MNRLARLALLALPLVLFACPHAARPPEPPPTEPPPAPVPEEPIVVRPSRSGLGFRVTEVDGTVGAPRSRLAKGAPLPADDERRLLERLPPLAKLPGDEATFALRDRSQPPPRAGKTVTEPFPPRAIKPAPTAPQPGPLTVTRHLPDGEVTLAPHLSVSFSQPMVAITSHAELERTPPPVSLSPTPPGKWRWIGAQTALFEPTGRFPMATEYKVEIAAGARSVAGGVLASDVRWTFGTPPPRLRAEHPSGGGPVGLEPLIFVGFDQKMDPAATRAALRVTAGSSPVEVRAATDDEIESDREVRELTRRSEAGRFVVVRPRSPLPRGARVTVTVPRGTASGEGPRVTDADQSFGFSTFGPMTAVRLSCAWGGECPPLHPLSLQFSNDVAAARFDKASVRVEPEIPGLKLQASGPIVRLTGRTRGRTKYKITALPGVPDTFGQLSAEERVFELETGRAEPTLLAESRPMMVLDPAVKGALSVFTVNEPSVRARLYAVTPRDWATYKKWRSDWDYEGKRGAPPGTLLWSRVVPVSQAPDELVETQIDLAGALKSGLGHVIVVVEPTRPAKKDHPRESVRAWVQVTNLGLDAVADGGRAVAWVTELATGAPLAGVEVGALDEGAGVRATSGTDGLARLDGLGTTSLVARRGDDVAALFDGVSPGVIGDSLAWLVYDDRKTYRPGEQVHVKGLLRVRAGELGGDVRALSAGSRRVSWSVVDSRGVELSKAQRAEVDGHGGFDLAFSIPKTPNLGRARVKLSLEGDSTGASGRQHTHTFSIEEFRRPEFEVTARVEGGPHEVGRSSTITVAAKYYAGGGLAEAPVGWRFSSAPARFRPANQEGYQFGQSPERAWFSFGGRRAKAAQDETLTGLTTGQGEHRVRLEYDALPEAFPISITAQASVTDVNRQAWGATAAVLVHPADVYVGLRPSRAFVKAGDALDLGVIVTDQAGKIDPGKRVDVRAARLDWDQIDGEMKELERDVTTCAVTAAEAPVVCSLKAGEAGRYRVLATVVDRHGRKSQTELFTWVLGDGMPRDRDLPRDAVRVVPDRASYAPGDTAELLVVAPFAPAEGLVTLQRQGLTHVARFTMRSQTEVVKVPIGEGSFPGVHARVDLVGATPRDGADGEPDPKLPPRPAFATGAAKLPVPPRSRTLAVSAAARDPEIEPGGSTVVDVTLRDDAGAPVEGATVAVVVADEAVLALGAVELPDPIAVFYAPRAPGAAVDVSRDDVVLAALDASKVQLRAAQRAAPKRNGSKKDSSAVGLGKLGAPLARPAPAPSMASKAMDAAGLSLAEREEAKPADQKIATRSDFDPLAAFAPAMTSDAAGRVSLTVKVPDNLTRYRVMAVAAHGERRFGAGEATLTARLPLMVRPSAPRFLNYGDAFELPILVQNQTPAALSVDVVGRASNALFTAGAGRRVEVPAHDRVEVRLPAAAARPGTARFQVAVASGRHVDAATVQLPVWTPATTEAFATYGQLDEGATSQQITLPSGVVREFGGLEVTTSSTQVAALTDAVLYLARDPFDCNEQLASRVMSIAALRDVLSAFGSPSLPPPRELLDGVKRDLAKLRGRQHWSGGFSFWGGDREAWPYLSIHVMHALSRAKDKGFPVPADTLSRGGAYLRQIERYLPPSYHPEVRRALVAYSLYVQKRLGDGEPARARSLLAEAGGVERVGLETLGWLLSSMSGDPGSTKEVEAIRRHLANRVSETAGAAHFVTSYEDGAHLLLSSDRRADGVILDALIEDQRDNDLIPKGVAGLLAHRKAGRWYNTQENAFVLIALDRYFSTYEKATPDFVARAWLGDFFAGEHAFRGRTTERHQVDVPMSALADLGSAPLVLAKEGEGRMYYRVGMRYAPADLRLPPAEHGFTVSRTYEGADSPGDVTRDADGTWRVKAGAKVRVRVSMIAPSRRYHVALVDPLPAGLEPMNPALAVTGAIPADDAAAKQSGAPWWWSRSWYEHQNLRDERVEAFTSLLWDGVYDYSYVARATTPGTFVVPPPKAEEMYSPETFGRGAGDRMVVE
ncbi:MAG: hypothetical protein IT374_02415 [Polyangiaceae bacterium]|nr:hypothetical protein [Polyangiaceae bacterium]